MSLNRHAVRRDGNEPAIIAACVGVGASVLQLSGDGIPDLAIWFRGVWTLGEVKEPKGKLRDSQDWDETIEPGAVPVFRTPEDALRAIGAIT